MSFVLPKQAATTRGSATPRADSAEKRHGGDSDCFYCGDFDSEEEIAHYLDLDDEWGITKSWALPVDPVAVVLLRRPGHPILQELA